MATTAFSNGLTRRPVQDLQGAGTGRAERETTEAWLSDAGVWEGDDGGQPTTGKRPMTARSMARTSSLALALCTAMGFGASAGAQNAGSNDANPMQLQPDHVTASVTDLDKEQAWYEKVFGFREEIRHKRGPDFEVSHLSLGYYHLDLAWQKGSTRQKETGYFRQGWEHVVFTTPAIEAAYDRLVKLQTDVRPQRNAQGQIWRMYVHDPEGNELEIVAEDGETRSAATAHPPPPLPHQPPPVPESVLPAGENRDLVVQMCTSCHPADLVAAQRRTRQDWDDTMARMIKRGAIPTDAQKALILDYLNTHVGSDSPPSK